MSIIPEDEEVISKEYDSIEIRKVKHRIEDQKKTEKNLIKDLQVNAERRQYYAKQIAMMDRRIAGINDILRKRQGEGRDSIV